MKKNIIDKDLFSFLDEEDETVNEILENEEDWNNIDWNAIPVEPNEKKKQAKNNKKDH